MTDILEKHRYWHNFKDFEQIYEERNEKYIFEKHKHIWSQGELITVAIYKLKRYLVAKDKDDLIDAVAFILMAYDLRLMQCYMKRMFYQINQGNGKK